MNLHRNDRHGTGVCLEPGAGDLLERPLNARSVIGSLLLGVHPPRLPGARIVEWCTRFGIADGTARVALSRMVDRGELVSDHGVYELGGRVRDLQGAQDWSLEPRLKPWNGGWRFAIVGRDLPAPALPARTAPDRAALRDAMRRLRHAELREGAWTRPDNLPLEAAPAESWTVATAQCSWWTGAPDAEPERLAAALFTPAAWATRAATLLDRLERVTGDLESGRDDALAPGFVIGAAALQQVRRDPLLPPALLPDPWPADDLRSAYLRFQAAFARSLADAFGR
jgi:phenylacetic acid degradation operon negative regulatory protein